MCPMFFMNDMENAIADRKSIYEEKNILGPRQRENARKRILLLYINFQVQNLKFSGDCGI